MAKIIDAHFEIVEEEDEDDPGYVAISWSSECPYCLEEIGDDHAIVDVESAETGFLLEYECPYCHKEFNISF